MKQQNRSIFLSVLNHRSIDKLLLLGALIALLYTVRASVLSSWYLPIGQLTGIGSRVIMVLICMILISKTKAWNIYGIVFALLILPGTLLSEELIRSTLNWVGWCVLFVIAGPLVQGETARQLRSAIWSSFMLLFVLISLASLVWYILGIPNLGRGAFTGIMNHSMLLGPVAAIACLYLLNRVIITRKKLILIFVFLAMLPCLLAGSRSAFLGLLIGILLLIGLSIIREGLNKSIPFIFIVFSFMFLGFIFQEEVKESNYFYRFTLELQNKGMNNSRESIWEARMSEFKGDPLVGVGVGVGKIASYRKKWDGITVDESGDVNIEPGSSYLAILSMTGLFGFFGVVMLITSVFIRLKIMIKFLIQSKEFHELLIIFLFFSVHMIAEGYIFAIGNMFCLLFWLSLGRLYDLSFVRRNIVK